MNDYTLICQGEKRRRQLRQRDLNGLDYLEVGDDQQTLSLYFINVAPPGLTKGNFRITGGERITGVEVTQVQYGCSDDPDPTVDVCVRLTLNKPGDYSTYKLCWVMADEQDYPTEQRAVEADPIYACLSFRFMAGCPSGLDCSGDRTAPDTSYLTEQPEIDYLAKDYASFRQLILDRLALLMPDWKERHIPDMGIALVEMLAYTGDYLSYYQDAVATEAYLETARQRISVRRHARLVDYLMHEGCNARAWVCVNPIGREFDGTLPEGTYFITGYNNRLHLPGQTVDPEQLRNIPSHFYEVFHPLVNEREKIHLYFDHNEIEFYTWCNQQCCLPKGTTKATLKGWKTPDNQPQTSPSSPTTDKPQLINEQANVTQRTSPEKLLRSSELHLQAGDVLIFEEIKGPRTGNPADADPKHRQAVRLTKVKAFEVDPKTGEENQDLHLSDPVNDQLIVEIEWMAEDALTFPLCLSALGPSPECMHLEGISVARGNVVLADHGRWVTPLEPLGKVPVIRRETTCEGLNDPSDVLVVVGQLMPPRLKLGPLTHREPLLKPLPGVYIAACHMLQQDPRRALPHIQLFNQDLIRRGHSPTLPTDWLAQRDLLASGPLDDHFVVEMDNDGQGHLRFGDGVHGRMPRPSPEKELYASYRIGNGPNGNVGAEAITHVVTEAHIQLKVRNPLPAQGGIQPEMMESVKLFAPYAFRTELLRAITPEDYVWLAERFPDGREKSKGTMVQRAATTARWTGNSTEILLVIDPLGTPDEKQVNTLLDGINGYIQRYRRIGHDVVVKQAAYIPLDIELCVTVLPQYFRGHVEAVLLDAFSNRRLPDGQAGFFHPDNLTFGEGIYVSRLIATAQAVTGVESVWVTRLQRMFEPAFTPEPAGIQDSPVVQAGLLRLGPLEIGRVDNDPGFEEHGRVVFKLEGGR